MKQNDVPQDESPLKKHKSNELMYALNDKEQFVSVQSSGWEPKSIIQHKNLEAIDLRIQQALEDFRAGKASPIVYFMEKHRMDWATLAAYVGKWPFFVKRHAKPNVFKKLSEKTLKRYADAFEIQVDELKNFKG